MATRRPGVRDRPPRRRPRVRRAHSVRRRPPPPGHGRRGRTPRVPLRTTDRAMARRSRFPGRRPVDRRRRGPARPGRVMSTTLATVDEEPTFPTVPTRADTDSWTTIAVEVHRLAQEVAGTTF